MLQKIKVDGFRSLLNFKMDVQAGLNVIVGANGTGKSNFISFLDFLGTMIENGLDPAIAVVHGAGSLFSQERFDGDRYAELTFTIDGVMEGVGGAQAQYMPFSDKVLSKLFGNYTYSCKIAYVAEIPAVYIASEEFAFYQTGEEPFKVIRSTEPRDGALKTSVNLEPTKGTPRQLFLRFARMNSEETKDPTEYLSARVTPGRSVFSYLVTDLPAIALAYADLIRYRSINIDPSVARQPTDVGSDSNLEADGNGLAGAIYHLKNGTYRRLFRPFVPGNHEQDPNTIFKSIVSWCREVNPAIEDVGVNFDVMDAQLRPYLMLNQGDQTVRYSLDRVSDGTVKWLALATALFSEPALGLIEEPENFLHPFMQESFVELCREALRSDTKRVLIISTHSPTLLDFCKPDELTLFALTDGMTRASKIANRKELEKKLNEARFGLGHYYRIGALHGENSSNS